MARTIVVRVVLRVVIRMVLQVVLRMVLRVVLREVVRQAVLNQRGRGDGEGVGEAAAMTSPSSIAEPTRTFPRRRNTRRVEATPSHVDSISMTPPPTPTAGETILATEGEGED
jgi:hypothetical protein